MRPVRPRHKPEDLDEIDPERFTADPHMPDRYLEPWVFDNNLGKIVQELDTNLEPTTNEESPHTQPYRPERETEPALTIPFKTLIAEQQESWDEIQRMMYKEQKKVGKRQEPCEDREGHQGPVVTPDVSQEAEPYRGTDSEVKRNPNLDSEVKQYPNLDSEVKQYPTKDSEVKENPPEEEDTSHLEDEDIVPQDEAQKSSHLASPDAQYPKDCTQDYLWINASPMRDTTMNQDISPPTANPVARCISPYEREEEVINTDTGPTTPLKTRERPKIGRELFPKEEGQEPRGRIRRAPMKYSPSDYDKRQKGAAIQMIMMIHTEAKYIDTALGLAEKANCVILRIANVKSYERKYGGKEQHLRREHKNPTIIGTTRMLRRKELITPEIVLFLKEYKTDEMEAGILEQAVYNAIRTITEKELRHVYVILDDDLTKEEQSHILREIRRQSYGMAIFYEALIQKEGDKILNIKQPTRADKATNQTGELKSLSCEYDAEIGELNEYHLVKKEEPWPSIYDRGIVGDHMIHSTNVIRMIQFLEDHPELNMPGTDTIAEGQDRPNPHIIYPGGHVYIDKKYTTEKRYHLHFLITRETSTSSLDHRDVETCLRGLIHTRSTPDFIGKTYTCHFLIDEDQFIIQDRERYINTVCEFFTERRSETAVIWASPIVNDIIEFARGGHLSDRLPDLKLKR